MTQFICGACGDGGHGNCEAKGRDKTWCDCQHSDTAALRRKPIVEQPVAEPVAA